MKVFKAGGKTLGIGTDIVHLPRFKRLLQKYPLRPNHEMQPFMKIARKYMHPYEMNKIQAIANEPDSATRLVIYAAGIWGIKESVLKALSCFVPAEDMPTAQSIYTKLIFKSSISGEKPLLQFDDTYRAIATKQEAIFYKRYIEAPLTQPLVSISHDGDYLVTFACLVEGDRYRKV